VLLDGQQRRPEPVLAVTCLAVAIGRERRRELTAGVRALVTARTVGFGSDESADPGESLRVAPAELEYVAPVARDVPVASTQGERGPLMASTVEQVRNELPFVTVAAALWTGVGVDELPVVGIGVAGGAVGLQPVAREPALEPRNHVRVPAVRGSEPRVTRITRDLLVVGREPEAGGVVERSASFPVGRGETTVLGEVAVAAGRASGVDPLHEATAVGVFVTRGARADGAGLAGSPLETTSHLLGGMALDAVDLGVSTDQRHSLVVDEVGGDGLERRILSVAAVAVAQLAVVGIRVAVRAVLGQRREPALPGGDVRLERELVAAITLGRDVTTFETEVERLVSKRSCAREAGSDERTVADQGRVATEVFEVTLPAVGKPCLRVRPVKPRAARDLLFDPGMAVAARVGEGLAT